MLELAHVLPRPGPVWGPYPQRPADALPWRPWPWRSAAAACRRTAREAALHSAAWSALAAEARPHRLQILRQALRREGLQGDAAARALGAVCAVAAQTLAVLPRDGQRMAAAALLADRMVEMATGEGKTLAIGLAAAVAALAGVPVHVFTANDYLAARDAARLAPLFEALGLRCTALSALADDAARRHAYGHDIVYATAKAVAFDSLRDRVSRGPVHALSRAAAELAGQAPQPPLLRGLCMALLDEADSILLDEAEVPLILSQAVPQAARRAFLWQALALARTLQPGRDFDVHPADRNATLSAAGEDRLAAAAAGLGGPWRRPRYRREAVQVALAALHTLVKDEHYVVRSGAIELLDEVTGRVAAGRVWSRGLHTVVALKEGLKPPPETETVAQTTFQRFFQQYWRFAGISGTLWEARAELHAVHGAMVVRIPLHRPCQRRQLPARCFADRAALWAAVAVRVAELQAAGRPVLVGTDSVADSQALSARLLQHGVAHRVLNALHDAEEAQTVAAAGRSGSVTVATRMAGRGTDIELDAAARAAGGLHVLQCQHNPSRRLDRQLAGRAGRQGDPGSAEAWTEAWTSRRYSGQGGSKRADTVGRPLPDLNPSATPTPTPTWMNTILQQGWQRREERRRTLARRLLLQQDLDWERRLSFAAPAG